MLNMKTPLLLFGLLCIKAQGQNSFNFQGMNIPYLSEANESWMKNINTGGKIFKSIEWTSSKYKKDIDFVLLDKNGMVTERQYVIRWNNGPFKIRKFKHNKFSYTNNLVSKDEWLNEKGESESISLYEYFSPNRFSHIQVFKKNKKKFESFSKYNNDSSLTESVSYKYKGNSQKLVVKYEYDYYEDKQRKQTRMINKKNKLKYTWNYACNPKGELVKEKTTEVCVNKGSDNKGRMVTVVFSTNSKGDKTKSINTYYVFNGQKIPVLYEFFHIKKDKEIKQYETHMADSIEPFYYYKAYDKKGNIEVNHGIEYAVYNTQRAIFKSRTFSYYHKGKLYSEKIEKFNEAGLSMGSESFGKDHKFLGKTVFAYNGDSSYKISHYDRKNRLTEVFTTVIQYY
jgi:hypothetical protein